MEKTDILSSSLYLFNGSRIIMVEKFIKIKTVTKVLKMAWFPKPRPRNPCELCP